MQTQPIDGASKRTRRDPQSKLLLIGSEDGFKSDAMHRVLYGHQFQLAGRSPTLLDGLYRVESEEIDLVLLSGEFQEEELSLFTFDARRRGFAGLILHIASLPGESAHAAVAGSRESPEARPRRNPWEREFQLGEFQPGDFQSTDGFGRPPHLAQPLAAGIRTVLNVSASARSISLTKKEQAVLTQVSEGCSNQQIAHHLNCSVGSVKASIQQLFRKLGVRKRAQIVRLAIEKTLIET
jgi:DNA-binding CsgD family transcriptional regulator